MNMEIILAEKQQVIVNYKGFEILTDQPVKAGGDNAAPSPFDFFLISIGACAGWYVKSFCQQRNLSEEGIKVLLKTHRNPEKRMIDNIEIDINLPHDFPDKYRDAVIKAAGACTVKKHIADAPEFSIVTSK
jgi:ribosomal protein S12 methylthiotransferase accessory factor